MVLEIVVRSDLIEELTKSQYPANFTDQQLTTKLELSS